MRSIICSKLLVLAEMLLIEMANRRGKHPLLEYCQMFSSCSVRIRKHHKFFSNLSLVIGQVNLWHSIKYDTLVVIAFFLWFTAR